MIVEAIDSSRRLLETNVIEAGERRTADVLDCVVGHDELLLPSHEYVVRRLQLAVVEVIIVECFRVAIERFELVLLCALNKIKFTYIYI